jgi:uncharacterized protein (TIGR02452 family)
MKEINKHKYKMILILINVEFIDINMSSDKDFNINVFQTLISSLKKPINQSEKVYFYKIKFDTSNYTKYDDTILNVVNENCIKTCLKLNKEYKKEKIGLLNMASITKLGGGVINGTKAQEEEIFRSTDIYSKVTGNHYPINEDQLIYTPEVRILQCRNSKEYKSFIDVKKEKCVVDVIFLPALRKPNVIIDEYSDTERYEDDEDRETMKEKIDAMFKIFIKSECKHIVLGALGCGVYKNPINEVISIYKELLEEYKSYFKTITFSVLSSKEDKYLYNIFHESFC